MLALTSPVIWYTSRATGIVALVLLSTTVALGLRTAGRRRTPRWPGFATAELHKRLSVITLVFLGLHILTGVADTFVHLGWPSIIVPFASTYKPFWTGLGTVAFDLLVAVAISSALRQRIPPHIWRGLHWLA
ncbi:MAG TPA: ferric reductase-like transmembrane domain-containing protein, partial [Acidimicrobiales bacterium]|nr:ferric reductase-like transmembrane domain-containing protein [Acidimicrobiales bacterium]